MAANQLFAPTLITFVAATLFALLCSSPQVRAMNYTFMKDATRAPNVSYTYYDFIIVGGGTAGCPLAATLCSRVLLLERGGSPYDDERIGDMTRFADTLSDTSPGSPTQRFMSADGVINSRPRVLGGGSCINAGFYKRVGCDLDAARSAYRWVEDVVEFRPELGPWQAPQQSGLLESGMAPDNGFTFDHIDGTKVGGSIFDAEWRRHAAADLLRYARPDGIDVLLRARVAKIIFNVRGRHPVARGVVFHDSSGRMHRAYLNADRDNEIILSADAMGSPQLLMLSGVGTAGHLRSFGIALVHDQPEVGQGMSDIPMNAIFVLSPSPVEISLIQVVGITHVGSYIEGASGSNWGVGLVSSGSHQHRNFSMFSSQTGQLATVPPKQRTPDRWNKKHGTSIRVAAFERSNEAVTGGQMFVYMRLSAVVTFAALVFLLLYMVHRWRNPRCSGHLPPGSMGLPLVGETMYFFSPDDDDSLDVPRFIRLRLARYGPIFKTSLVGHPVVVSTDEELNHLVFQQEGQLFQSWYPDSFVEILGRDNVGEQQGAMFKYLKNMVLRYFGPESLRESTMLRDVEHAVTSSLCTWSTLPTVELKEAISTMVFDLSANKLLGLEPSRSKVLRKSFFDFARGLISFPLYLPGTAYYSCMKGRQSAMEVLQEALEERKRSVQVPGGEGGDERARRHHVDFLDSVIQEITREEPLVTDKMALDLMFVLLFASFHTTSLALTLTVKLLTDHPHVLEELMDEHETIIHDRKSDRESDEITWMEYKSMTFTSQVINETVRLANIAPGIFRKALKDIEFKGYTIPAGWGVMVCPPAVHLNPDIYPDPLTFNPSRFKDKLEIKRGSRHFMAFGGGLRFCVGADFSKLQMSIFLHFLVTKYWWKKLGGGKIVRTPGLEFPGGYHIQIRQRN